jgi:DNA-binding transcriptional MerR regulator
MSATLEQGSERTSERASAMPPSSARLKMKDVCDATGLPRQAVHFYIQQGLVPPGEKTGRNMAYYTEAHVERLKLVRRLQHERFLPLKAIKALLDDQESQFSAPQRAHLLEMKSRFTSDQLIRHDIAPEQRIEASEAARARSVSKLDLARMIELGLLGVSEDAAGKRFIAERDTWLLDAWSEVRSLEGSALLNLQVDDMLLIQEVVQELFNRESLLLASRMDHIPADQAAELIERALPLIHVFLTRFHFAKIRDFFGSLD